MARIVTEKYLIYIHMSSIVIENKYCNMDIFDLLFVVFTIGIHFQLQNNIHFMSEIYRNFMVLKRKNGQVLLSQICILIFQSIHVK